MFIHAKRQQGFSLFIVMIIMLVIALLVIVTNQSSSTEMRVSANEADRKYALTIAESGLRDAENRILGFLGLPAGTPTTFTYNCTQGFCAPAEPVNIPTGTASPFQITGARNTTPAWKRSFQNTNVLENQQTSFAGRDGNVRYIIEYLGQNSSTTGVNYRFRVTARAKGQNPNTIVTLQTTVELTPP